MGGRGPKAAGKVVRELATLAAVLGGGCFGTSGVQTGVVVISTTPAGARAFVNGVEVCAATPCNWTEGNGVAYRYHVQVQKPGYKDVDFYLDKDLRFFDAFFTLWAFRMPTQLPLRLELANPNAPGQLHGVVTRAGNAPIADAKVEVAGLPPVACGPDGTFTLAAVTPGAVNVTVSAYGFKTQAKAVTIIPGTELAMAVMLEEPKGPGRIRGAVFAAPDKPGAARVPLGQVTIDAGKGPLPAAPDGTFVLEAVGPGPVQVKAAFKGYKPAEEVVSVPAEGEAAVEFTLQREAARALASMRGQVRTLKGKPVGAQLQVPEAELNVKTGNDGRFNIRVPGGKYTVVFEAPGYVRQTKVVEVADGDQAIIYVDLSKEDR